MRLHRAAKQADWELIPPGSWNHWQRLAARTHKVVTPGNIVSLCGLMLVAIGLVLVGRHHLWAGVAVLGAGRLLDIVDGLAAEHTGTKSHIGEGIDAGFDKLAALGTLAVFTMSHVVPLWLAVLVGVQNAATALLGLLADIAGRTIHPNIAGKLAAGGLWVGFGALLAGAAAPAHWLARAGGILVLAAVLLGTTATLHYMRGTFTRR
ncbi:MAG TPA: CDP-alcohol phosphatidyltransferase family protein [Candidatus Saccharimonadales bacterium]|nr:CDP-alcohol phosphatidyltransferase family protein [Candidatus Saccharimonadales bacterium]